MSYVTQLTSLLCAGMMMATSSLQTIAPQNDVNGNLFLVNRIYRVSKDYVPETTAAKVQGTLRKLRPDVAAALEEMFAACKEETGATLLTVSGYRSYDKQQRIYSNKLDNVGGSKEKADEYVARPGASEHQMGLAMDVGQKKSKAGLTSSFAKTTGGKWVAANCWRFGFILRYQEGWEAVTGYNYEPWHVRYVGKEQAKAIYEANVPMETYLEGYVEELLIDLISTN